MYTRRKLAFLFSNSAIHVYLLPGQLTCIYMCKSLHSVLVFLSQDPIKQPLLKKLLSHNEELQQKAVSSFLDILSYSCISLYILVYPSILCGCVVLDCCAPILKYMGDYPSKKQRLSTDLTDPVFEHALVHVSEVFFLTQIYMSSVLCDHFDMYTYSLTHIYSTMHFLPHGSPS